MPTGFAIETSVEVISDSAPPAALVPKRDRARGGVAAGVLGIIRPSRRKSMAVSARQLARASGRQSPVLTPLREKNYSMDTVV